MRRTLAPAVLLLAGLAAPVRADVVIEVFPSVGPNPASPSAAGYAANAAAGVGAGGTPAGPFGTPAFYAQAGASVSVLDIIATDFPSWRGTVNPGGPFAGELGNRLFFGARLTDPDGQLSLGEFTYAVTDTLDGSLSTSGSFAGLDYSASRVGVIYDPDGGPPTFLTSGSGSQNVNELWLAGVSVGLTVNAADLPGGVPTDAALAAAVSGLPEFSLEAVFRVQRERRVFTGDAEVLVTPVEADANGVPAPAGLILGLIAVMGFMGTRMTRIKARGSKPGPEPNPSLV